MANGRIPATDPPLPAIRFDGEELCTRQAYLAREDEMKQYREESRLCEKARRRAGFGTIMSLRYPNTPSGENE